jgi:hypothetical protein
VAGISRDNRSRSPLLQTLAECEKKILSRQGEVGIHAHKSDAGFAKVGFSLPSFTYLERGILSRLISLLIKANQCEAANDVVQTEIKHVACALMA